MKLGRSRRKVRKRDEHNQAVTVEGISFGVSRIIWVIDDLMEAIICYQRILVVEGGTVA